MSSRPVQVASRRKRAQPAVSGGIPGSYDDKDSNFAWYAVSVNLLCILVIKQPICHNTSMYTYKKTLLICDAQ